MSGSSRFSRLGALGHWYTTIATRLWNVLLVVILLNLVLWPVFASFDGRPQLPAWLAAFRQTAGPAWASLLYPGWDEQSVIALYDESFRLTFQYDSVTQFTLQPTRGTYYKISEHGFRLNGHSAPWPPDPAAFNVFVFGGSTTFALGLPDSESIPAALESMLQDAPCGPPARVYNFGVPAHASVEERARFEQLLVQGTMPRIAVFVDGINDSFNDARQGAGNARSTDDLARMMALANTKDTLVRFRAHAREVIAVLPMTRLALAVRGELVRRVRDIGLARPAVSNIQVETEGRVERWLANKQLVEAAGEQYGVQTLFVWQPAPIYNYVPGDHLIAGQVPPWPDWTARYQGQTTLYDRLNERRQDPDVAANLLWLADLQATMTGSLYVDPLHYTAAFSREIARAIADDLRQRGWLPCAGS